MNGTDGSRILFLNKYNYQFLDVPARPIIFSCSTTTSGGQGHKIKRGGSRGIDELLTGYLGTWLIAGWPREGHVSRSGEGFPRFDLYIVYIICQFLLKNPYISQSLRETQITLRDEK